MRGWLALALLALAGCTPEPQTVRPALWEVKGPHGETAWLFGTIHALPGPVAWRSSGIDAALRSSDSLVLEIAQSGTDGSLARTFAGLGTSPGLPPLADRLPPAHRARLLALLKQHGIAAADYDRYETWAAALAIAKAISADSETRHGLETALLDAAAGKPVRELEGGERQLGIFDTLPEQEQRDLLAAVIEEAADPASGEALGKAWGTGDMNRIAQEARTGMLADPELRAALLVDRNRDWAARVAAMLQRRERPFVAVGAAHMAGPDGLPALLQARGYAVTRIQ